MILRDSLKMGYGGGIAGRSISNEAALYLNWDRLEGANSYEISIYSNSGGYSRNIEDYNWEYFDNTDETTIVIDEGIDFENLNIWIEIRYFTRGGDPAPASITRDISDEPMAILNYVYKAGYFKHLKPNLFEWQNPKIKDKPFDLLATEWNSFCNMINRTKKYALLNKQRFKTVHKNDLVLASHINAVRDGIYELLRVSNSRLEFLGFNTHYAPPPPPLPNRVVKEQIITASLFHILRDILNYINRVALSE